MTPLGSILLGTLVAAVGASTAFAGAGLAGPKNPECGFFSCFGVSTLVEFGGVIVAFGGALLVALGLGRRWSAHEEAENVQGRDPPSPRDERGPP